MTARKIGARIQKIGDLPGEMPHFPAEIDYGREILGAGSNFEILEITWPPGRFCEIHDHGASCANIFVSGIVESRTFDENEGLLKMTGREIIDGSSNLGFLEVRKGEIHQMGNPSEEFAVSLHIYRDDGSAAENGYRLFDMISGAIRRSNGPAYFFPQAHTPDPMERTCSFVDVADEILHAETALAHINRRIRDSPKRELLNLRVLLEERISRRRTSAL